MVLSYQPADSSVFACLVNPKPCGVSVSTVVYVAWHPAVALNSTSGDSSRLNPGPSGEGVILM